MKKLKSSFVNNIKALLWALLIAGFIRTFAIEPFKIPSGSMKPNLLVGDFLFVSKWDYGYSRYSFPFGLAPFSGKIFEKNPSRGDIIVFKLPGQENINYVKRLVGLPGETIKVVDGLIYIKNHVINDLINFYNSMDRYELYEGRVFKKMFMTSFLQTLIDSKWKIKATMVENGWLEVDTVKDLEIYSKLQKKGELINLWDMNN